jgi:hypothetical protein
VMSRTGRARRCPARVAPRGAHRRQDTCSMEGCVAGSAAARRARRRNLRLHCADGAAWVAEAAARARARAEPPLDLVLLDAFDGADAVPACFTQPGAHWRARLHSGPAVAL